MTAFGKLIRTTAFRLTLVYLFLFALFAASLLGYFAWNTRRLITEQITTTVNAEASEISDIYISELRDHTYYAKLRIRHNGELIEVDSRPSDAIALAVTASVPIYVAEDVLNDVMGEQQ